MSEFEVPVTAVSGLVVVAKSPVELARIAVEIRTSTAVLVGDVTGGDVVQIVINTSDAEGNNTCNKQINCV